MRANRFRDAKVILLAIIAVFLRVLFLSDMEFKGDEKATVELIASAFSRPFSFLAPISAHSGIAHSSLVFYFIHFLSAFTSSPMGMGLAIALFNASAVIVPLWFLRRDSRAVVTFGLCSSSLTLVLASRKIWVPDLMAPWVELAMGLILFGIQSRASVSKRDGLPLSGAAFLLVMSGHMYLPGVMVAIVIQATFAAWFFRFQRCRDLRFWMLGSGLGWLTFVPYGFLMLTHAEGTRSIYGAIPHRNFDILQREFLGAFNLSSGYWPYDLYLRPMIDFILKIDESALGLLIWLALMVAAGTALYGISLFRVLKNWSQAKQDPLVIAALVLIVVTPLALFGTGLGNHLHYWFGVLPVLYYLIGWATHLNPETHATLWLKRLAVLTIILSAIASVNFHRFVHENGGIPGEYGASYSSQVEGQARWRTE